MSEIKEIYLWIAFFVLVIVGAVYLRYYYQPSLSLSVNFVSPPTGTVYPYQQVTAPFVVQNTGGSAISNLSFGLYVNSNLTRTYRMSIPSGKSVTVNYNFTPSISGSYNVSIVADPNRLYNIQNRNLAQAKLSIVIANAEKAEPQVAFNTSGIIGEDNYNMSIGGYNFALFLFNNTGANQFALTSSAQMNNLIYPTLSVYYNYIQDISIAHAYYENYTLVSLWIKGYLTPSAIDTAAVGRGLNATMIGNVTVVNFGNSTTMCSWYSNGWLKSLGVINGSSCTKLIGNTYSSSGVNSLSSAGLAYRGLSIYNYSGYYGNYVAVGSWAILNNSFLFQSVARGSNFTNVCYGTILSLNNISYCNTYYIEPQNTILVKTNALLGMYNFTTWALTANITLANQTKYDVGLIKRYNVSGQSSTFVTGYLNSCYLTQNVWCDATWSGNSLEIGIINGYNSSIYLQDIACYAAGARNYTTINQTISPGGHIYVQTPCYRNGTAISGVALGLDVYLNLNYIAMNKTVIANGDAQLVGQT